MVNIKKRTTICVITLAVIMSLVFLLMHLNYLNDNTRNAKILISNSNLYSDDEILSAIDIALARFRNYPADLQKIYYDEAESQQTSTSWAKAYGAKECIILYSDFKTYPGEAAAAQGFSSDTEYDHWNWILIRNSKDEEWQLKTWGFGA